MISPGLLIGRVRGIELRVHLSLWLLMAYLVFVISAQFRMVAESAGVAAETLVGGPVLWGVVVALGLFASILLHELGHARAAQSMGVQVKSITLMMLGGVSQMEKIPMARYAEMRLALWGPAVSIGLAALLYFVSQGVSEPNFKFLAYWLSSANLMLGIFNLIPAFPMDGGRALRSFIAARHGELRATRLSVRIGRGFAWALGLLGVISFNFLLVLIAFFIYTAGQSELYALVSERALRGMRVRDLMIRLEAVQAHQPLTQAADRMVEQRATLLPVRPWRGSTHLLSYFDLRRVPQRFWQTTQVKDVMSAPPRVLQLDEPVLPALPDLMRGPIQALPVEEGGEAIGLLRYSEVRDFLQLGAFQAELEEEDRDRRAA